MTLVAAAASAASSSVLRIAPTNRKRSAARPEIGRCNARYVTLIEQRELQDAAVCPARVAHQGLNRIACGCFRSTIAASTSIALIGLHGH
jgi:hypothetical protein